METRTIIDFRKDGGLARSVSVNHTIPNVAVGQSFAFDHPSMLHGLVGTVTRISHVVFLGDEPPLTYIDVEVLGS